MNQDEKERAAFLRIMENYAYSAACITHVGTANYFCHAALKYAREEDSRMRDALQEIALAGMGLSPLADTGPEAEDRFHARQAWRFISIAANALSARPATPKGE